MLTSRDTTPWIVTDRRSYTDDVQPSAGRRVVKVAIRAENRFRDTLFLAPCMGSPLVARERLDHDGWKSSWQMCRMARFAPYVVAPGHVMTWTERVAIPLDGVASPTTTNDQAIYRLRFNVFLKYTRTESVPAPTWATLSNTFTAGGR
jgi:hypothetical protein